MQTQVVSQLVGLASSTSSKQWTLRNVLVRNLGTLRFSQLTGYRLTGNGRARHTPGSERGRGRTLGWGGRDTLQGSWRVVLGCRPGSSEELTACCCQALVRGDVVGTRREGVVPLQELT